jgi:diazepam-binding inhibitor (GABA receptor modulating acyl-CoA-binding protein)
MSLDAKFSKAVAFVQSMPKEGPVTPSNEDKLLFYGLFKQASDGPCTTKSPSRLNFVEKAKWDAWSKFGKMSKDDAKKQVWRV